jgi:MFS family permease
MGLAVCLSLYGDLTLYAVLATQLDTVGLALSSLGIMLSINRLIRLPGNPLAGLVIDRFGRRRPFLLGLLLGVLTTASYGFVLGFGAFFAGRLLWGVAWALINVSGTSMVLDISDRESRGRNSGVLTTWIQLGFALGPLMGGLLVDGLGFRPAMHWGAAVSAVGLAIAALALPETAPAADNSQNRSFSQPSWNDGSRWIQDKVGTLLGPNRPLLAAAILHLVVLFTSEGVTLSTLTLLLQQRLDGALVVNGMALGAASAGGVFLAGRALVVGVTGPLAGYLSDRFIGRQVMIAAGMAAGIAGFAILAKATSLGAIVSGVMLGALCTGSVLAGLTARVGDLTPPSRQGTVIGAYATAGDIGSTAGPLVAYGLLAIAGLEWVYGLCAASLALGLLLLWQWGGDVPKSIPLQMEPGARQSRHGG